MAAQGTALTPTLAAVTGSLDAVRPPRQPAPAVVRRRRQRPRPARRRGGESGVVFLAGTDSRPHGRVADEVRALTAAGVRPHDALAAASWPARSYLGLPCLTAGAPADVVVYDEDPHTDLSQLDHPATVVLRGAQISHRR